MFKHLRFLLLLLFFLISCILCDVIPVISTTTERLNSSSTYLQLTNKTNHEPSQPKQQHSTIFVWSIASASVTLISFCPLSGLILIPFLKPEIVYHICMTILQGMGVGSLLGTALFHLIPQSFQLASSARINFLWIAGCVCGGMYLFYLMEHLIKLLNKLTKQNVQKCDISNHIQMNEIQEQEQNQNPDLVSDSTPEPDQTTDPTQSKRLSTIAWMIILADVLHNFIDGTTIGAAFSQNVLDGISISVGCFSEEFPHKLGDFSILLSSGMPIRNAVKCNLLLLCPCYLGMVCGLLLGGLSQQSSTFVFAFAAGMFLYISLVDMMTELARNLRQIAQTREQSFVALTFVLQNVGLIAGLGILFGLAKFGGKIVN